MALTFVVENGGLKTNFNQNALEMMQRPVNSLIGLMDNFHLNDNGMQNLDLNALTRQMQDFDLNQNGESNGDKNDGDHVDQDAEEEKLDSEESEVFITAEQEPQMQMEKENDGVPVPLKESELRETEIATGNNDVQPVQPVQPPSDYNVPDSNVVQQDGVRAHQNGASQQFSDCVREQRRRLC
jgi:hypothetical protein